MRYKILIAIILILLLILILQNTVYTFVQKPTESKQKQVMIPIPRNQSWNATVKHLEALSNELEPVYVFMKDNEQNIRLYTVDLDVLTHLDEAIKQSEELTKNLKNLKKEIK